MLLGSGSSPVEGNVVIANVIETAGASAALHQCVRHNDRFIDWILDECNLFVSVLHNPV